VLIRFDLVVSKSVMTSDCVLCSVNTHYLVIIDILPVKKSSSTSIIHHLLLGYFKYVTNNKACPFVLLSRAIELTILVSVSVSVLVLHSLVSALALILLCSGLINEPVQTIFIPSSDEG